MLNQKEIGIITIITIILAFTISLIQTTEIFLYTLLSIFLIIIINVTAKKIIGYYLESEVEIKLWEIQKYGLLGIFAKKHPSKRFKNEFPIGAIMPLIVKVLSLGYITWLASLIFDVKPKTYRAAKRHGLYSFTEMTEYHLALIAASGIFANLFFAVIGYLIGAVEFAKLNTFYAFFNMIPISKLDGNKIFFGSLILWSFLASLILIGIGYIFLLI